MLGSNTQHLGIASWAVLFLTGYAHTVQDTHLALGADALTDRPHLLVAFFFSHIFYFLVVPRTTVNYPACPARNSAIVPIPSKIRAI
jgi:hypothetical protein